MLYLSLRGQRMDPKEFSGYSKNQSIKTVWQERQPDVFTFICPLCKRARSLAFRTQPGGFKHIMAVGVTTLLFMLLAWNWFSWKGLVAFVPFWSIFEVVYRWRTRAALFCKECGFDPYLFKTDLKVAKREVEVHWRKKYAERGIPFPEKRP